MHKLLLTIMVSLAFAVPAFGQTVECPSCESKVAVGLYKKSKEKKTVYEVTTKEIAVPYICLPKPLFNAREQFRNLFASKCCPGEPCAGSCEGECCKDVRNGQVRVIKVMKKTSVECDICKHEWEVTDVETVNKYLGYEEQPQMIQPVEALPQGAMQMQNQYQLQQQYQMQQQQRMQMSQQSQPVQQGSTVMRFGDSTPAVQQQFGQGTGNYYVPQQPQPEIIRNR